MTLGKFTLIFGGLAALLLVIWAIGALLRYERKRSALRGPLHTAPIDPHDAVNTYFTRAEREYAERKHAWELAHPGETYPGDTPPKRVA